MRSPHTTSDRRSTVMPLASHSTGLWLSGAAVTSLALALRLVHLDVPAHFDELYHVLAARGWLAEGEFHIAEGVYDRAPLFTLLVAGFFAVFGESLEVARLPSVLAGTMLALAVFLWTRRQAGTLAAWVAALLLAFWADAIEMSQFARFYALHGLLVFLGAIAVFAALDHRSKSHARLAAALGAALALYVALTLQVTTLILLVSLGVWFGLTVVLPWLLQEGRAPAWRWSAGLGLLLALLLAAIGLKSGLGQSVIGAMFSVPLHNERLADRFWYYHGLFSVNLPLVWALFGGIVLAAVVRCPRPALFCMIVFASAISLHSIAAPKHIRYVYYVVPFLFILTGMAAHEVLPRLWRALKELAAQAWVALGLRPRAHMPALVAGLAAAFVPLTQPNLIRVGAGLAGIHLPPDEPRADWAAVQPELESWLEQADVVLTRNELAALYYMGGYDLLISKSRLSETPEPHEFTVDPRTGRRVLSTPESVALVIDCHATGVVVSEEAYWRNANQLDDDVADVIVRRAEEIPLPPRHRIRAFYWQQPTSTAPERCAEVPKLPGP